MGTNLWQVLKQFNISEQIVAHRSNGRCQNEIYLDEKRSGSRSNKIFRNKNDSIVGWR